MKSETRRSNVSRLTDLPNVGEATAAKLRAAGITTPSQLAVEEPYALYDRLCERLGTRLDPCLLDVLISAVRYMEGEAPKRWWEYTRERKEKLAGKA